MITVHNSGNTAAAVTIHMDEFPELGPFPTYVGSYDNLREVAKAAAVDSMVKAGWTQAKATRVALTDNGNAFHVTVRRQATK